MILRRPRSPKRVRWAGGALLLVVACGERVEERDGSESHLSSADPEAGVPSSPSSGLPWSEAESAIDTFETPTGFRWNLFAAEPDVVQPVALDVDLRGRVWVAESFRVLNGVPDDEHHLFWLLDDLACQTLDDRRGLQDKWASRFRGGLKYFTRAEDRVRRLEDRNGDGRCDSSVVFADGYRDRLSGLGAGVLSVDDTVFYSNIPHLWSLTDSTGDGVADETRSIAHGFGVRYSYSGHDLHGLTRGLDGRLYFSIGDRGYDLRDADGAGPHDPATGAVFRCDLDGSNLEVYCTGLRNPQELAFDDFGNLFTVDNNADSGDKARVVFLMEGATYGWRMEYQFLGGETPRGPWNLDQLWKIEGENRPAYALPPIGYLGVGPAGLAAYPGFGLPSEFENHFFLADYTGHRGRVIAFTVAEAGAGFQLSSSRRLLRGPAVTDLAFGVPGQIFLSDWTGGFVGTGKGRIYTLQHDAAQGTILEEWQRMVRQPVQELPTAELLDRLNHPDRRLRQSAQFEFVRRGAVEELRSATRQGAPLRQRCHGVWGLGQLARENSRSGSISLLVALMDDADPQVRALAVRAYGEVKNADVGLLLAALSDSDPRVASAAALALRAHGGAECRGPLLERARREPGDAFLRHAVATGLAGTQSGEALAELSSARSPVARMVAILALRQQGDSRIATFLNDEDPSLASEAALAIYDRPIPEALTALAKQGAARLLALPRANHTEAFGRRVLGAMFRRGGPAEARQLIELLAGRHLAPPLEEFLLALLLRWKEPPATDPILGVLDPLDPRDGSALKAALAPRLAQLVESRRGVALQRLFQLARRLDLDELPDLRPWVFDSSRSVETRCEAFRLMWKHGEDSNSLLQRALDSREPKLRMEAVKQVLRVDPRRGLEELQRSLSDSPVEERQLALRLLARVPDASADRRIAVLLEQLLKGEVPAALMLDVVEAARERSDPEVRKGLKKYLRRQSNKSGVAAYRDVLEGGSAELGTELFRSRLELQCARCHTLDGTGDRTGPDLQAVGRRLSREELLSSVLWPDEAISPGYETVVLFTNDGEVVSGTMRSEDSAEIVLMTAAGDEVRVEVDRVRERRTGKSSMPAGLEETLTRSELRDLVEFLASLQG